MNEIHTYLRKEYSDRTGNPDIKDGEFTPGYVQYLEQWIHKARSLNLVSIHELREDIERLKETGHLFNGVQFEYVNVEDLNDLFEAILSKKETEISVKNLDPNSAISNLIELVSELRVKTDDNSEVIKNVVFDHIQDLQTENAEMKERIKKLENKLSESKYCNCEMPNYYMDRRCVKCGKHKEQYAKQAGR